MLRYQLNPHFLFNTLNAISTLILAEPVLATILAWWLLGEKVGLLIIVGGVFVGAGIYLVSRWSIEAGLDKSPVSANRKE